VAVSGLWCRRWVKADLTRCRFAGVGGALPALGPSQMSLLCLGAAARLARLALDGPAFTSISRARRAGRPTWRSPSPAICLAISGWRWPRSRWSPSSRWSTCFKRRCARPLNASPEKRSSLDRHDVVRNPLIWACVIGLAAQRRAHPASKLWHEVADALGRASLAMAFW